MKFITTEKILKSVWKNQSIEIKNSIDFPKKLHWTCLESVKFKDVECWEEIFYNQCDIGIYAAWSPFAEFYIIVNFLFLESEHGIEYFQGNSALEEVLNRAQELGIDLTVTNYWIDNIDKNNFIQTSI
jgi:hypothetical protein